MQLKDHYGLLINGEWTAAEGGKEFETTNPATGEHLAWCADASAAFLCMQSWINRQAALPVLRISRLLLQRQINQTIRLIGHEERDVQHIIIQFQIIQ